MGSGNRLVRPNDSIQRKIIHRWRRRHFVKGLTALAGATALSAYEISSVAAQQPLETTRLTLINDETTCIAPMFVAETLLQSEGFTDIRYLKIKDGTQTRRLAAGEADISLGFASGIVKSLDAGDPLLVLAGIHPGCFELFGTHSVRAIHDLHGKTVAVLSQGSAAYLFLSSMAAYVGLDPIKDIRWVEHSHTESMRLLAEGKVDAFLAFPPYGQELRAKHVGHLVVNTSTDPPWSQYFCCMLQGNRDFVRKHPVATKRAVRAILKATDVCAQEPERAARLVIDRGFASHYDYTIQTLREVPYNTWRVYDPETTLRFYALRLREAGMIKSSPQKIIAQGTDWRFLNELKRELKA